jgi:hypothetical protein
MRKLDGLGGDIAQAFGLNNAGVVVGSATVKSGPRACLWINGRPHDLNGLVTNRSGWQLTTARAINDKGEICGWGRKAGHPRAFLLRPTP